MRWAALEWWVESKKLWLEWWVESKKVWRIVGPAVFQRIALYGINAVSQAFIGHLGALELAAFSIAATVVAGFNFGFLLGMASALETLCGQAFGAKKYHMLGVYLQRSWIALLLFATLLTPTYILMEDLLLLIGQSPDLARLAGKMSVWLIPQHFAVVMLVPLTWYLQSQLKNWVTAVTAGFTASRSSHPRRRHLPSRAPFKDGDRRRGGDRRPVMVARRGWPVLLRGRRRVPTDMEGVLDGGVCSLLGVYQAFLCLWSDALLGELVLQSVGVADRVQVCFHVNFSALTSSSKRSLTINGWELMIPLGFLAATGVRVANELGAGSGKDARFAIVVSITTSIVFGFIFWCLILYFNDHFALLFTLSKVVLDAVHNLSVLLAFTVLLNSVQPVLSGVAIGSGWQALVAYVNVGSYYLVGVPLGVVLGWPLRFGVGGIWSGLIGGTAVQTLILAYLTARCDWDEEARKSSTRMLRVWATSK